LLYYSSMTPEPHPTIFLISSTWFPDLPPHLPGLRLPTSIPNVPASAVKLEVRWLII
jgi:hypothetical protein